MSDASLELRRLSDKLFDGQITAEELSRLETLCLASPELRRQFIALSHLNASLQHQGTSAEIPSTVLRSQYSSSVADRRPTSTLISGISVAIAALSLSLLIMFQLSPRQSDSSTFAAITTTPGSHWLSASIPTWNDSRIGAGHVQLADGIARFAFDNGATVEIEGPAELEILDSMHCRLVRGKLVATITPESQGFRVDTPDAVLIDQGTSFGVNVSDEGLSSMQVFEGLVDVEHLQSGTRLSVKQSETATISADGVAKFADVNEAFLATDSAPPAPRPQVQVTTATGGGKDQWIIRDDELRYGPGDLLMIKLAKEGFSGFDRKIYLQFDLTAIDLTQVSEATFDITAAPTGIGYASRMPDATFAVYVLTDDQLDDWQPEMLTWENAPANVDAGNQLAAEAARLVGQFTIPRGQKQGTFRIDSNDLAETIRSDTDGRVTIVLVPQTREAISGALVHGFAGSLHPTLPPPTLRLILND
ncbi:FecR domain-containing protein [Bremerella cremea]|uniref:FecR domain-containing protein n=1 Tax=Bremerella cremea TaxID=1031537 RepID=UPI0031E93B3F